MSTCPQCGNEFSAGERHCPKDGALLEEGRPGGTPQSLGRTLAGKYRLEQLLSRGGMGAVYRGTHLMLGKPVAIKLIHPGLVTTPEMVRRFQREARAASQLSHPNIVTVYDLGQDQDGALYIAMELVEGADLKPVLRGGPMEAPRAAAILAQICGALELAHSRGVIHRDLKPQNVMLCRDSGGREIAKLLDFGIAKTFEGEEASALTSTGAVLGTPHYMSPEQAAGRVVDSRSDLYSLGIILYEMLVGQAPFHDTSVASVLYKHVFEAPTPPSQSHPDLAISPALERIAMRCLEKEPARRYASAQELLAELQASGLLVPEATVRTAAPSGPPSDPTRIATAPSGPPSDPTRIATAPSGPPKEPAIIATQRLERATQPTVAVEREWQPAPAAGLKGRTWVLAAAAVVLLALGAAAIGWRSQLLALLGSRSSPLEAELDSPRSTPAMAVSPGEAPQAQPSSAALSGIGAGEKWTSGVSGESEQAPEDPGQALSSAVRPGSEAAAPPPFENANPPVSRPKPKRAAREPAEEPYADTPGPPPMRPLERAAADAGREPAPGTREPAAPLPEDPPVFVRCSGAAEICGVLRGVFEQALARSGLPRAAAPARAEIVLELQAAAVDERSEQQFGTTFVVRTYTIDLWAEAPRFEETLDLPAAEPLSFDSRFGSERLRERARVLGAETAERIRSYWNGRR